MKHVGSILLAACFGALTASAQYKSINPQVSKIASEVSEERITAALKKLQGFGTRNLRSSQDDPNRGIGAARKWIYEQFHSYSPRLEVSYDHYRVKKDPSRGSRIPQDVDVYNVVAVLPGTINREQRIVIGAHYDSVNRTGTPRGQPGDPWTFTLAMLGEYLFQAVAFAIQIGIVFEVIGESNPLAATTFAFLTAATNVPVTYMMVGDGRAYSTGGVTGTLAVDASISIAACLLMGLLLSKSDRKPSKPAVERVSLVSELPQ